MKALPASFSSRRSLAKFWLSARMPLVAILVLGTALGGGSVVWDLWSARTDAAYNEANAREVGTIIARISNSFVEYTKTVDAVLMGTEAAAAINAGDNVAKASVQAAIMDRLPSASGVVLTGPKLRTTNYDAKPPISFTTLDLMRRSRESGAQAPLEVHLFGRQEQHLAMIRRVTDSAGGLAGFAVVGFSMDEVERIMAASLVGQGYMELIQRLNKGKPLVVAKAGDATFKGGLITHAHVLPDTAFRLLIWLPRAPTSKLSLLGELLPILFAMVLLVLVGVFVTVLTVHRRRRLKRSVKLGDAVSVIVVDDDGPEGVFAEATAKTTKKTESKPALDIKPVPPAVVDEKPNPRRAEPAALIREDSSQSGAALSSGTDLTGDELADHKLEDDELGSDEPDGPATVIFRAYDIRGIVGQTLDSATAYLLGQAIGTEAYECGQQTLMVARDGRLSSDELASALISGLIASGRDVIDIGRVPTPVLYFSTYFLNTGSGIMVTGSHNPPEYNGFKIMLGGEILFGNGIQRIRQRALSGEFRTGVGQLQNMDILADYIRRVTEDMPVALSWTLKLVVDCGNGVAGDVAPKLFRALGYDVSELYCEVDGNFPNHHPDPSVPDNLIDLCNAVQEQGADLGIALDGDGDRVGIVDNNGVVIWPDQLMMVYAKDMLSRHAGAPVVFDVKSTSRLPTLVQEHGGKPVMDKTGHSFMRNKLKELSAPLAGELSGHIFFGERWYGFDDGMYAAARLLEILITRKIEPSKLFAEVPVGVNTPELRLDFPEGEHFSLMKRLLSRAGNIKAVKVHTFDGLRVEFDDGWGLVRASNTTPSLVFRFEADDVQALARIQNMFRKMVGSVVPVAKLPF